MQVAITNRPIRAALPVSRGVLTDILGRIASIRGRASDWGVVNDATRAELLAGQSLEADFVTGYYRDGFVQGGDPAVLPGWSFARTGVGLASRQSGLVTSFSTGAARITDRGLLVEGQRTNLLLHSATYDAAEWSPVRASLTPNVGVAPDGTITAVGLATDMTAADSHGVVQNLTGLAAAAHVASVWAKAADRDQVALVGSSGGLDYEAIFSLAGDGAVISATPGTFATMVKGPDGWFRVSAYDPAPGGSGSFYVLPAIAGSIVIDGNGATALLLWNAQLEASDCPTSDIVTTTAPATRGLDKPALDFAATSDFSVVVEVDLRDILSNSYMLTLMGATIADRLVISRLDGNQINVLLATQGVESAADIGSRSGDQTVKVSLTVLGDQTRISLDGGAIQTIAAPRPPGLTLASIGILGEVYDALAAQAYVRQLALIRRPLSDAELMAASS